jgi:hypothetical protein
MTRLNLAVATQTRDLLSDLQRRTGAASLEEVVRRALAYFDILVRIEEDGGRIVVEPKKGSAQQLRLVP